MTPGNASNDGYPDSRDPEPVEHALKRIAREAREIRQRLDRSLNRHDHDMQSLATLVADLADVVRTQHEEKP